MRLMLNKTLILLTILFLTSWPYAHGQEVKYKLDSIAVTAKRTGLTIKDNLITYDISKDSLAALKSMRTLVSSMPLVTYEQIEGKLKVNGKENVIVLLNGRKSLVVNKSNFSYISEFLHGKEIQSISIDISPTGAYAGYDAVINIVSKEILSNFYSGSLSASASTEYKIGSSAGLTVAMGRLALNASYGYGRTNLRPSWNYTESRNSDGSVSEHYIASDTTKKVRGNGHNMGLNLSYDITPQDIIFFSSSGSFSGSKNDINSFSQIDGSRNYFSNTNKSDAKSGNGSVAYQHFFDKQNQKMLTLQYSLDGRVNKNQYGATGGLNRFINRQQTLSADYLHTINSSANWNLRLAWFARKYDSKNSDYTILNHNQDVVQTELNGSKRVGKFRFSGKAAYDFTADRAAFNSGASHLNDDYGCFHYMARVQYFPRAGHTITLSTSRNVYRPDISVRNPYRDESVPGVVRQGNPLLSNEKSNGITLSYVYIKGFKYSLNFSASYRHSSNGVFATTHTLDDGRLLYTYENGIKNKKLFISPGFMWNPSEKFNINAFYRIGWNSFGHPEKSFSYIDYAAYLNAIYKPWKGGEVMLNGMMVNPSILSSSSAQSTKVHYIVTGFVQFAQHFGPLMVGLTIDKPWYNRENIITEYEADGRSFYSKQSRPAHTIGATLRYTFGRAKSSVKRNAREVRDSDRTK